VCGACAVNETDPAPMIGQTAGFLVAFFRQTLQGDVGAVATSLTSAPLAITQEAK